MDASSKLMRQWRLLQIIAAASGMATIKSLVADTGMSEKTLRRDVALLRKVGFPVEETVGEFGRKTFTLDGQSLPRLDLLYDEGLALCYCRSAIQPLAGTYLAESLQNAFRKIEASLGQRAAKYVARMAPRLHRTHVSGDYARQAELIDQLLIAIDDAKATFITYQSARSSEALSYPVEPYGLVEHRGSFYLVGHSQQHDEVRHWKVDRIEAVDVTEVRFQRPADFDLAKHLAGSFGIYHGRQPIRVRVRLNPSAARYVREKRMHASQRLRREAGGSAIVQWTVSSLVEVRSFVLSFGSAAEVLEPEELRVEVAAEAEKILASYRSPAKARIKT